MTRHGLDAVLEMNPQMGKKLRTVAVSPRFIGLIAAFSVDLDEEYKQDLVSSALQVQKATRGKQVLTLIRLERFRRSAPEDLKPLEKLVREHRKLTAGE